MVGGTTERRDGDGGWAGRPGSPSAPGGEVANPRRASIDLALAWQDDPSGRPYRVEPPDRRCPATATVRVFGGDPARAPVLEWRTRRLFRRASWRPAELVRGRSEDDGAQVWRADLSAETGNVRTRRLEARAQLADQVVERRRMVVSTRGRWIAIAVLLVMAAFVTGWLYGVPSLGVALGLGGVGLTLVVAAVRRARDASDRGPLWGLGVPERALGVAVLAAVIVVLVPPLVLVIVDNQTLTEVRLRTYAKTTVAFGPHEGRTLLSWDRPAGVLGDKLCMCPAQDEDPACPCRPTSVRRIPVVDVQCRLHAWQGMGAIAARAGGRLALTDAATIDGQIFTLSDEVCEARSGTARFALGDLGPTDSPDAAVTVRYPWRPDLEPVLVPASVSRFAVAAAPGEPPLLTVEGMDSGAPMRLPAIDPAWSTVAIDVADRGGAHGTLACEGDRPLGGLDVIDFDVPARTQVAVTSAVPHRGTASVISRWRGDGGGRACLHADAPVEKVELDLQDPAPGTRVDVPDALRPARFVVRVGAAEVKVPPGARPRQLGIIGLGDASGLARSGSIRVESTDDSRRTWDLESVQVGSRWIAVAVDPPAAATPVRVVVGARRLELELAPGELRRPGDVRPAPGDLHPTPGDLHPAPGDLHPAPGDLHPTPDDGDVAPHGRPGAPPVCVVRPDRDAPIERAERCPPAGRRSCQILDGSRALEVMRAQAAAGTPCELVCLCR